MDDLTRLAHSARLDGASAAEALVRASYDDVWRLCAALVDERTADDLAQETFLRVVRTLHAFRGDASARTWILSIARRTCMDELRSRTRRRRHAMSPGPGPTGPLAQVSDVAEDAGVYDLLRCIDDDRRAAFILTQMLGLSYAQAATVCECPTGTVRSRVARAREELVALLEQPDMRNRHDHDGRSSMP